MVKIVLPLLGAQVQSWLGSLGPACLEWSGLPFPSPGDLPDPRDRTQVSRTAGRFFTTAPPKSSTYYLFPFYLFSVPYSLSSKL